MNKSIEFIYDSMHAWAAVPLQDVHDLGIFDKVSKYSYYKDDTAYLEEDCDAPLYINKLKEKYPNLKLNVQDKYDGLRSVIRDYKHFHID